MEIIYAILSILSCIAIFFKDIIVANIYGANTATDAFFYVYQIAFIVLAVLGGIGGPFYKTTILIASDLINRPKTEILRGRF